MNLSAASGMNDLVPSEFYLSQNYPNPFKEKTTIKFCVAYKTKVKLEVFNTKGERVKVLVDEDKEAGTYEVEFNTTNCHSREGGNLLGGNYIYELQAGDYLSTKEMNLLQ